MISQRASISQRLAIFASIASVFIGLAMTYFNHQALRSSLRSEARALVSLKIHSIETLLSETGDDRSALREEINWSPSLLAEKQRVLVRILNDQGDTIENTPGAEDIFQAASGIEYEGQFQSLKHPSGKLFLMKSEKFLPQSGKYGPVTIQVALDLTQQNLFLDRQRFFQVIIVAGGALATLLAVWVLSGIAARPIEDLVQATRSLESPEAQELHESNYPPEIRPLAHALNQLHRRFREQLNAMSSFTQNIAHEVRNPLNIMMGEAELSLSRPRTNEEYRDTIESFLEESRDLASLADAMLFLARAENKSEPLSLENHRIRPLMEDLVDFYSPLAEEKDISVEIRVPDHEEIFADRVLLRRAVANLLCNGIQHCPERTLIRITCEGAPGSTRLIVEDSGPGIPEDLRSQVFERFFTQSRNSRTKMNGTGLGLSICRTIARLHDGDVTCDGSELGGARFVVSFPNCTDRPGAEMTNPISDEELT